MGAWAQSAVQAEKNRRNASIVEAQEQIITGDTAYNDSKFDEAVAAYRGAYAKVPIGEETKILRDAVRQRYAQAAVEAARVMNRQGNLSGAIGLMDEVLGESVAPSYQPAIELRAKLDDPIRTNPSLTPEHARDVDEVRRILYKAEGAYNLADFDLATNLYESVLRIDPYNKAARRGMSRTNAAKSDYAGAAYDQARSELLTQVDKAWELEVAKSSPNLDFEINDGLISPNSSDSIDAKLDSIIFQRIDFDDISLVEALDFLNARSITLDNSISTNKRGVDFVLNTGTGASPEVAEILAKTFDLKLRNVSLRVVLDYVTRLTSTRFQVEAFAVKISPLGGITNELIVRQYQVPATFLSQSPDANSSQVNDIFAGGNTDFVKLAPRLTAMQFLEQQGVDMPDGATASYTAATNTLTVRTTQSGQDLVRAIVDSLTSKEPIAVVIETRIVNISQTNLDEIGFETAVTNLAAAGEFQFGGGTQGTGSPSQLVDGNPVSSGLRSGDLATSGDPLLTRIDTDIQPITGELREATSLFGAPGALSVFGTVGDYGLGLLLKGLDQKSGADLMSQPSVIVRSGEQALIQSVQEFIYPTEFEPPELPNGVGILVIGNVEIVVPVTTFPVTPSHPTAFETRGVGTVLEVMPEVSADRKTVALKVNPRIDDFVGFINYGTPILGNSFNGPTNDPTVPGIATTNEILQPVFSSIRANTTVEVANNRTIVIGGLINENVEKVEDKVPVLGDIPLLGNLFTSEALRREKSVLMIFVTVRLVDPGGNSVQN